MYIIFLLVVEWISNHTKKSLISFFILELCSILILKSGEQILILHIWRLIQNIEMSLIFVFNRWVYFKSIFGSTRASHVSFNFNLYGFLLRWRMKEGLLLM